LIISLNEEKIIESNKMKIEGENIEKEEDAKEKNIRRKISLVPNKKHIENCPLYNIALDVPLTPGLFTCVAQFSVDKAATSPLVGSVHEKVGSRARPPILLNILLTSHIPLPMRYDELGC
jgi:hypothetical protein